MNNSIITDTEIQIKIIDFYIKYCNYQKENQLNLSNYYNLIITNTNEIIIPHIKIIVNNLENIFIHMLLYPKINITYKNYLVPLDFFENIFCSHLYTFLINILNKNTILITNDEKYIHYLIIQIEYFKYNKYINIINNSQLNCYPIKHMKIPRPNFIFICSINQRINEIKERMKITYNNLIYYFPELIETKKLSENILIYLKLI